MAEAGLMLQKETLRDIAVPPVALMHKELILTVTSTV